MRKSHRQKVADRRKKRRDRARSRKPPLVGWTSIFPDNYKIDASLPSDKRPMTTAEMDSLMFFGFPEDTNPSAEPTEKVCPECEGTGWSYHEHLPIERHVGCEDCGGCGDERGTGVTQ